MLKGYKEQIMYFLKNKKYIIPLILVGILSLGFAITHESIGIDDLAMDRYTTGTYFISAKRWTLFLIYNILNIKEFTPFWIDFIASLILMSIAILICSFIKKNFDKQIKSIWVYTVFSCIFISSPIINHFFLYQASNIGILISTLAILILVITYFEIYFNKNKNKKYIDYILLSLLISVILSIYEASVQVYLVFLFLTLFLKNDKDKKKLIKYFAIGIGMLCIGIILYYLINFFILAILKANNKLVKDYSNKNVLFLDDRFWDMDFINKIGITNKAFSIFVKNIKIYFPIGTFIVLWIASIIIEIVNKIKRKSNYIKIFSLIFIGLSNMIIPLIEFKILYRTEFSLIITIAFFFAYIYNLLLDKKYLKYIINILILFVILNQSRMLNQFFYNDYKRYERDKFIANYIAIEVVNNYDYKDKPLIIRSTYNIKDNKEKYFNISDDCISLFIWGLKAFDKPQEEIIKFINHFGFNFIYPTEEQINNAKEEYDLLEESKKKNIVEFENYIVVNLDKFDMFV